MWKKDNSVWKSRWRLPTRKSPLFFQPRVTGFLRRRPASSGRLYMYVCVPTGFLLLVFSAGDVDLSPSSALPFYIVRVSYAFIVIFMATLKQKKERKTWGERPLPLWCVFSDTRPTLSISLTHTYRHGLLHLNVYYKTKCFK